MPWTLAFTEWRGHTACPTSSRSVLSDSQGLSPAGIGEPWLGLPIRGGRLPSIVLVFGSGQTLLRTPGASSPSELAAIWLGLLIDRTGVEVSQTRASQQAGTLASGNHFQPRRRASYCEKRFLPEREQWWHRVVALPVPLPRPAHPFTQNGLLAVPRSMSLLSRFPFPEPSLSKCCPLPSLQF